MARIVYLVFLFNFIFLNLSAQQPNNEVNCFVSDPDALQVALNDSACEVVSLSSRIYQGNFVINRPLTLQGEGETTILTGGGLNPIIIVTSQGNASISDLKIQNGISTESGTGISNSGDLILTNVTITNNRSQMGGGGLYNEGTVVMNNVVISQNQAEFGAGIYNAGGMITLNQSSVINNVAEGFGGGINNDTGIIDLHESPVARNFSGRMGGGIFNFEGQITNSCRSIARNIPNQVTGDGGYYVALTRYCPEEMGATIEDDTDNTAISFGAGDGRINTFGSDFAIFTEPDIGILVYGADADGQTFLGAYASLPEMDFLPCPADQDQVIGTSFNLRYRIKWLSNCEFMIEIDSRDGESVNQVLFDTFPADGVVERRITREQ